MISVGRVVICIALLLAGSAPAASPGERLASAAPRVAPKAGWRRFLVAPDLWRDLSLDKSSLDEAFAERVRNDPFQFFPGARFDRQLKRTLYTLYLKFHL